MAQTDVIRTPRISVVLCTYRGTAHLEEQLQSLLVQTVQPEELIVCDDQSFDGTVNILQSFRAAAPFSVRIIENSVNLGSTRNFDQALQLASGEYLALCDQDDLWYPDKLATLAKILDEDPGLGGVFSDATLMDGHGAALGSDESTRKTLWKAFRFDGVKQKLFMKDGPIDLLLRHDIVTGATLMVRASARPLWHPIPASWVHDGWIAWMLTVHSRLALVPRPLMAYRVHAQQQIGIGKMPLRQRLEQLRRTERIRYSKRADSFEDLRDRIAASKPSATELKQSLDSKIELLRRRAALSHSFPRRVLEILSDTGNYRRYARGWRSMRKDLLLS